MAKEKYGATLAHILFQLWYLARLNWLFSKWLVIPRLLMEAALRLDRLFWRNRGCAVAILALKQINGINDPQSSRRNTKKELIR